MWGSTKEDPQESGSEAGPENFNEEDMNLAEKLTAVVGVLFVEKYEYTVDGLYYGGAMIKRWWGNLSGCGYQEQVDDK